MSALILPRFYQDRTRYALPTQLCFLFQRAAQVRALSQPDLFAGPVIADFMIDKDSLFARLTLSDDEFALYRQVYSQLQPQAPAPDLDRPIEERRPGGLGLHFIRGLTRDLRFEHVDGTTIVTAVLEVPR